MALPYDIFQKWSSGKTAINIFLKIPNAWTAEMISYLDFDAITIEMGFNMVTPVDESVVMM